ncbi:MAG TPA: hypothetical protein PKK74_08345 [Candidatus Methanoculleus thermohydrogenotrophicum]|nr:hypothetical protein [Candidatus Methanoculleus thermohydrogenotrophicum]NLM82396.1 hypothetical protein [Candidatus Methanoculleus thermohydrogenotrophicum]HOB18684.1 hypothetical protein [Candidatus Methanoculleus thermohydrogenotrophicum]HPZ38754.1 hypothetical protein [Candidatus Methanoculleus thermohydrogenotrophicum]HQC91926.1 hypothetical protein [Candidatus Methanoculleus thermohydrogenotrophicum]
MNGSPVLQFGVVHFLELADGGEAMYGGCHATPHDDACADSAPFSRGRCPGGGVGQETGIRKNKPYTRDN